MFRRRRLIAALGTLRYPTQLARFQVPINRVKLIHKDSLRSADVQQDVAGDRGEVDGATSASDGPPVRGKANTKGGAGGAGVPAGTAFAIGEAADVGTAGSNGGRSG